MFALLEMSKRKKVNMDVNNNSVNCGDVNEVARKLRMIAEELERQMQAERPVDLDLDWVVDKARRAAAVCGRVVAGVAEWYERHERRGAIVSRQRRNPQPNPSLQSS